MDESIKNAGFELMRLIDEWIKEKDISGTKFNQDRLDRLNKVNVFIAALFGKNAKKIAFNPPNNEQRYCFTYVVTESIDIVELDQKERFKKLIDLTDTFAVLPVSPTEIHISFSVDNIWEE